MISNLITVLTPTYNRGSLLKNLYKSLCQQEVMNFNWLIIDDGSNDDTELVVKSFKQQCFNIRYFYKENGGKHTAINYAMSYISTPLTIIVDSDDLLLSFATRIIEEYFKKYENRIDCLCSFSFLRCYSNGNPIVSLDKDEFISSYPICRVKENRPGDMAEVYISNVLKSYRFPEIIGERFLSEDVVWISMGISYKTVYINKAIYMTEYLEGGLTSKDKKAKFSSPIGSMYRGLALMNKECGIKANIRGAIIYDCYKIVAKKKFGSNNLKIAPTRKLLCKLMTPVGALFYYIWRP